MKTRKPSAPPSPGQNRQLFRFILKPAAGYVKQNRGENINNYTLFQLTGAVLRAPEDRPEQNVAVSRGVGQRERPAESMSFRQGAVVHDCVIRECAMLPSVSRHAASLFR